ASAGGPGCAPRTSLSPPPGSVRGAALVAAALPGLRGGPGGEPDSPHARDPAGGGGGGLPGGKQEVARQGAPAAAGVAENATADRQHQRPVPLHQRREGPLLPARGKVAEQLGVAEARGRRRSAQLADVIEDRAQLSPGHGTHPGGGNVSSYSARKRRR